MILELSFTSIPLYLSLLFSPSIYPFSPLIDLFYDLKDRVGEKRDKKTGVQARENGALR
jgi:hypothetical protein